MEKVSACAWHVTVKAALSAPQAFGSQTLKV
jgi:hypothetical protein